MSNVSKLYEQTREGLDIVLHYYPQAAECVADPKKKFKAHQEKTPSAVLKKYPFSEGGYVYKVTDFGDDGHALSPIDICMKEEGIDNFREAIAKLMAMFNVVDELNRAINKPEIRKKPATMEQEDGKRYYHLLDEIPEEQLKVLGPRVKAEHAKALHWHAAEWICYVHNREATYKYSTPNYPIFMRECLVKPAEGDQPEVKFYKVYEPLNPEKQYRFSYTPEGVKPRQYINGLAELKEMYRTYNAKKEADWKADPANEDKPYKEEKLDEAFICSGERDSLCCKSIGYPPIWFNSETYRLSEAEYKEVMKYVKVLYNIPDIDNTGIKKGTELALRFREIYTIWLPSNLSQYKDNRGRGRKDLRDWMEIHCEIKDFRNLMALAMPAKFWTERVNQKSGKKELNIDAACLHYFLKLNGFYTLHDENNSSTQYIRIEGNIVKPIRARDIRRFIRDWAEDNFLDRDIRNLILNSPKMSDTALENLSEIELDFTNYTPTSQFFFFQGATVEVTPTDIIERKSTDAMLDRYVWERNVQPRKFVRMDDMFTITRSKDSDGKDKFDIEINGEVKSCIMGYVVNSSRIHWRKEMEYNFAENPEDAPAYKKAHRFDIAGEGLELEEITEQKQNLINKIFAIGYMLHRFKSRSRAWAPQAMDNKIGEDGQCNGRSGKSFLFQTIAMFENLVTLSGRNPRLMDNPHVFDRVNQYTDFVLVDDCSKYFPMEQFYDIITGDMTVNPKNNQSFSIPFDISPKFGFSTNYVPLDFDPSTEARLLYMVYSDYYHQASEDNDYLETRTIRDDFGHDLLSKNASDDEYNADVNFLLQCCRFYLSLCQEPIKILPPMHNIIFRKKKQDMGAVFEEWANVYFAEDGDNLDRPIVRSEAFEDYQQSTNAGKSATIQKFTNQLKAFVDICPYVHCLNPKWKCNSKGRLIMRDKDGKAADHIYLESVKSFENGETLDNHSDDGNFTPDEQHDEAPF